MEAFSFYHVVTAQAVAAVVAIAYLHLSCRYFRLWLILHRRPVPKTSVGVFIEIWRTFVGPRFRRRRPPPTQPGSESATAP